MVCWLKFLNFVNETLKEIEQNLPRRKKLAIDVLKEIEKEEGHDIEKIEKRIKKEGKEGLIKIAKLIKEKNKKEKKKRKSKLKAEIVSEEVV